MAIFYNQASLTIGDTVTNSNIAQGELLSGLTLTKTSVGDNYRQNGSITYVINISGTCAGGVDNLTVTDDLGSYVPEGLATAVVPLDYADGTLLYYSGGVLQPTPTVTAGPPLTISGLNLPEGGNIQLIYQARVNNFAPLDAGSCITNTASVSGAALAEDQSDDSRVCIEEDVALSVSKSVSPDTVCENGTLTYTFVIQNMGNRAVEATDGAVISDTFNPILSNLAVTVNGTAAEEAAYTYNAATGEFATANGTLTIPAATFTRDTATGTVTVTPGVTVVTVSGNV